MISDAVSAVALFVVLVVLRFEVIDPQAHWDLVIGPGTLAVAYGVGWVACLWFLGLYRLRKNLSFRGEVAGILRATALASLGLLSLLFIFRLDNLSRVFILLLLVSQPVLTIALRLSLRQILRWLRSHGYLARQMLIIGSGAEARAFAHEVEVHRDLGLTVLGHLSGPRDDRVKLLRPIVGGIDDLSEILHSRVVDEVAICLTPQDWEYVEPITRICEEEGKIVRISMRALGGTLTGGQNDELGNTPIVTFLYGPDRVLAMVFKRLFDLIVSAAGLVVLSPILLIVGLYVRIADGPPVLFTQQRVGLHGRMFSCVKFRTMELGADERLTELAEFNEVHGPAFKIADDPRVTNAGRRLRRSSLDELPQLWNVLRGDMSVVGPRPAPQREVDLYSVWHRRRLSMRPGLTGLWQVSARNDPDFNLRVALDLDYIDRWSLWMDLKILARTIPVLVAQDGH